MTEQTQPTDAEIDEFLDSPGNMNWVIADKRERFRLFARAVLAKWGTPAGAGEPYGYVYTAQVAPIVGDERKVERTVFTRNKPPCNALALYTTPQPTQAQAGAVPTRAFLERTLAAMEGVIDVADRKTDEFDALRSCVIDLTLMLFSDAKRQTNGASHER